jgi:plastocyanin
VPVRMSRLVAFVLLCSAAALMACSPSAAAPTSSPTPTPKPSLHFTTVEATSQPAGSTLVEMVNYEFRPAEISVKAGKVVLYLVNSANEPHAISLRDEAGSLLAVSAQSDPVAPGHSAIFTIDDLPVGSYRVKEPLAGIHGGDTDMLGHLTSR